MASLQSIQKKDLQLESKFFAKGKTYFIQVVGATTMRPQNDEEDPLESKMNAHFYYLKKQCRKKGVPIFAYKIDVRDF